MATQNEIFKKFRIRRCMRRSRSSIDVGHASRDGAESFLVFNIFAHKLIKQIRCSHVRYGNVWGYPCTVCTHYGRIAVQQLPAGQVWRPIILYNSIVHPSARCAMCVFIISFFWMANESRRWHGAAAVINVLQPFVFREGAHRPTELQRAAAILFNNNLIVFYFFGDRKLLAITP